ncbi:MAG: hypothetical protein K6G91_12195 [Kiritimatiellae bacterium]|nr:hypothetical protein [Kiritimatiellia bacterium]
MKKISILVVAVVAVGAAVWLTRSGEEKPAPTTPQTEVKRQDAVRHSVAKRARPARKGKGAARPAVPRPKPKFVEIVDDPSEEDSWTPAEKALAERIEKALDDESFEAAISCAAEAQTCNAAGVRKAMVSTLGWFGERAIPELTPFLADADEDVREDAMNEWSMAVSAIDDEAEKIGMVERAMVVLSDEDALEDISGEYIGVDEKIAVESLLRIIESGSPEGVAKAKETYEFVTGDEFTDRAAAEKWLAEEYQPDEEEPAAEQQEPAI